MPKKSSLPRNTPRVVTPVVHISSSHGADLHYQRLELLLIGFASMVVTFLWVGVFATVFQQQTIRVRGFDSGSVTATLRGTREQVVQTVQSVFGGASLIGGELVYQVTALWDSSCLSGSSCVYGTPLDNMHILTFLPQMDRDLNSSHAATLTQVIVHLTSLQFHEAYAEARQMPLLEKSYASDVLGADTVSADEMIRVGLQGVIKYVDRITFGAISAIEPDLVEK